MSDRCKAAGGGEDKSRLSVPRVSVRTLTAIFSEDDPGAAIAKLYEEQPLLVESIFRGWLESERESAIWAAALCYAAIKQELEAAELDKLTES